MRLNLWSSPRNISTALMYAFAQRADTAVVDEPLYAHYLLHQRTNADHPGKAEILNSQENDGNQVVRHLLEHDYGRELVIIKQMTHHLEGLDADSKVAMLGLELAKNSKTKIGNVLLIRDPRAILASFSKVVSEVTAEDIGLPQQYALYHQLKKYDQLTAVIDARKLLLNPTAVLGHLCERLGFSFQSEMLHWKAGPIPEDGVWAKYWYGNVHQSNGFQPFTEKEYQLSGKLEAIALEVVPDYQEMLREAL